MRSEPWSASLPAIRQEVVWMEKVIVINGSPRKDKGFTARLLKPFAAGLGEAGADVETICTSGMGIAPCSCGRMHCWTSEPGVCCLQDAMQALYPRLAAADILVLATPVYVPFPGEMQNLVNRLVPLMDPKLSFRDGRTRAICRASVAIRKLALVATGDWWEKENLDTLVRIARELAADMDIEFAGALLRPHASYMTRNGVVTPDGQAVLDAAKLAGRALIEQGRIPDDLGDAVSRPLVPVGQWLQEQNA